MDSLLALGLSNALVVAALAPWAALAARGAIRAGRPALAHGIWLLVVLKLVTPPVVRVSLPLAWPGGERDGAAAVEGPVGPAAPAPDPDPGAPPATPRPGTSLADAELAPAPEADDPPAPPVEAAAAAPAPAGPTPPPAPPTPSPAASRDWRPATALAWLASSAGWLALATVRIARFRRALRRAGPAPEAVRARVESLAPLVGLARTPRVVLVHGAISPLVWALGGRACLVVPSGLWDRLDDPQRDTMILHELAHLRRRDHWVRALELAATGLYWWHPALWLARRGLHEAEEQCCDAWVVWARPEAARTYAEALVEAVDFLSDAPPRALPVGASGMGRIRHISRRIVMIMKGTAARSLSWLGLATLVVLGAVMLPLLPTWGQQEPTPPRAAPAPGDGPAASDLAEEIEILAAQVAIEDAGVAKAEAQRKQAEVAFDQLRRMVERGIVSREEMAKAEGDLEYANAAVDEARARRNLLAIKMEQARRRLGRIAWGPGAGGPPVPPQRAEAMNHLKQIGLALHNFLNAHGDAFPAPAIADADGKPLLSWRVAILPYLDEQDLYQQFHLDEPWDSPHNKALVEKMPRVFADPAAPTPAPVGWTDFRALVGPDSPWGRKIFDVTDGVSNTVLAVASAQPVPWTAPDELAYECDPGDPDSIHEAMTTGPVGALHGREFLALFGDGSVRGVGPLEPFVLHAIATRSGGEVIDAGTLQPRSGGPTPGAPPATTPPFPAVIPPGATEPPPPPADVPLAAESLRMRARAAIDGNHLKQIGLALHNYHDAHGHFPPRAIRKDGKPLLSWRVAILPYIEQQALYEKFHLDEPWDSPHNKALAAEVPELFHPRGFGDDEPGTTRYLAPDLPGTFWDKPEGVALADVTDGTANTAVVLVADAAVPWTKPEDLDESHAGSFANFYQAGGRALFADGSVRLLRPANPIVFRAVLTRAGGEVIDANSLQVAGPRPPFDAAPLRPTEPAEGGGEGAMLGGGAGMMMAGGAGDEEIDAKARELFLAVPAVAKVVAELEDMEAQLEKVKRAARNFQDDPAYRSAARRLEQLKAQYHDYWRQLYPRLREQAERETRGRGRMMGGPGDPGRAMTKGGGYAPAVPPAPEIPRAAGAPDDARIADLEARIADLQAQLRRLKASEAEPKGAEPIPAEGDAGRPK
jgi:beta-lactamase regulating signal transducer with metallopeptidase domain